MYSDHFDGWYPKIQPFLTVPECCAILAYAEESHSWEHAGALASYSKLHVKDHDLFKGLHNTLLSIASSELESILETDLWIIRVPEGIEPHTDEIAGYGHLRINICISLTDGTFLINDVDFGERNQGEGVTFRPDLHKHEFDAHRGECHMLSFGAIFEL